MNRRRRFSLLKEHMDVNLMTVGEFRALPESANWHNQDIELFDSLVILPSPTNTSSEILLYLLKCLIAKIFKLQTPSPSSISGMHDSGYRLMDFIACKENEPICRLSGCSDVLDIDGIGGFGYKWSTKGGVPTRIPPKGWEIDCLRTSGLLRLFKSPNYKLKAGQALSDFEIYAIERPKKYE